MNGASAHAMAGFAFVVAAQARILGMAAENAHREACGNSPAYGEEAFNAEAAMLEQIAIDIRENG